jgi:IclR family pca regulon transcriptional regulator
LPGTRRSWLDTENIWSSESEADGPLGEFDAEIVDAAFAVSEPKLTISEIAEKTGLSQSTVFRLVYTLEKQGYLKRDPDSKRYRQSARMLTLSLPARTGLSVRGVALPYLEELSRHINESTKLAILDQDEIVFIAVINVPNRLTSRTELGQRSPAYCTALGRVLLAFLSSEKQGEIIDRIRFTRKTEKTITDPEVFRAELEKVRTQGYALQDQEFIPGLAALAAPIFGHGDQVEAAISLSMLPSELLHSQHMDSYTRELLDHAVKISEALGYLGSFYRELPANSPESPQIARPTLLSAANFT